MSFVLWRGLLRRLSPLLLLAALAALPAAYTAAEAASSGGSGVARATLENGLRVVIVRNTLAPVVTTSVNYLVGAAETPPGFPGMAHAQEHMMFRGTPGLTADQLANIGGVMGGSFNADTRQSVTQYYFTVPAEDLDVALHIEALRMRGVLDREEDWKTERGAIEQEVAQDLSSPTYVLFTKLRAALFKGTTYAHDALGTRPSFDKTTGAMLKAFYDKWYAPNNAVLIAVGDLDPAATLAKVKELFGPIPPKKLPPRPQIELQPVKAESIRLKTDLPYGLQVLSFRMPGLASPDFPAAEVLVDVLTSERGPLHELVPEGKALYTDFSLDPLDKAGLGYATAAFAANGDGAKVEREVRAVLKKVRDEGVSADLVAAAKLQERRSTEFSKNSISGLAMVWAEAVAVYGLAAPEDDLARIDKVTVEDVNRVARKYLDLDHSISALLTPQGTGKPISSKGFGGLESFTLAEGKPAPLPAWASAAFGRLEVPPSTLRPVVSTLANGIKLIVQPEDVSDAVSVYGRIMVRPELLVPAGREGLSQVLNDLFGYGSVSLDRLAFQRALDAIGAEEVAGADFALEVMAPDYARGVELLADNLLHPALPAQAFAVVKRQIAQLVAGRLKSPNYLVGRALRGAIYPKGDPTLRQALPETVNAITREGLLDYYRAAFRPDLTTIVVIGKITPEAAKAAIEKYFGAWSAEGAKPATVLPPVPPSRPSATNVPDPSRVQDRVELAETVDVTRASPDYYVLRLGNSVLSGSLYSSRFSRVLRKQAGLVYFATSYFEADQTRGAYFIQYACDPQNVSKVESIILREVRAMQSTPVTAEELERAKATLLRDIPLREASMSAIARGFLDRSQLELPLDEPTLAARHYLDASAAEIENAFAKLVRTKDLARVTQGPIPH